MSAIVTLLAPLFKPITKWVFRTLQEGKRGEFIGDVGGELVGELVKLGFARDEALAADSVVHSVISDVAADIASKDATAINYKAVAAALESATDQLLSVDELVARDLDRMRLLTFLRSQHPPPRAQFSAKEEAVYDRGLEALTDALLRHLPRLPKYSILRDRTLLVRTTANSSQLAAIRETVAAQHRGINAIERLLVDDPHRKRDEYLARYLKAVRSHLDELDLFGVDVPPGTESYRLSVAYISLTLETSKGESFSGPRPAASVLDSMNGVRLLIRGDAGTGKSTLLKWMSLQCAGFRDYALAWSEDSIATLTMPAAPPNLSIVMTLPLPIPRSNESNQNEWISPDLLRGLIHSRLIDGDMGSKAPWKVRIPFLIRLRDCAAGKLPPISRYATETAAMQCEAPPDWVDEILRAGLGLVLLDGIDEVPTAQLHAIQKEVTALVSDYGKSMFVLTSRPLKGGDLAWLRLLGFQSAEIAPMSASDRDQCIDKWFEAVGIQLRQLGCEDADHLLKRDKLKADLRDSPDIARLATNPLLCAMVCALHRQRKELPRDLRDLMEALCHMLLFRREQETPGLKVKLEQFDQAYLGLNYEQRKVLVSYLAEHMVEEGVSALARSKAQHCLADALEMKSIKNRSSKDAPAVLDGLLVRSGMIREKTIDTVDFVHNAFKEYLAATRFFAKDRVQSLLAHCDDPNWENILVYAAAVATTRPSFGQELLSGLLYSTGHKGSGTPETPARRRDKRNHSASKNSNQRMIVAMKIWAAMSSGIDRKTEAELKRVQRRLFPPRSLAAASGLASAGNSVLRFVRFSGTHTISERRACVRTLRLIGTPEAAEELLRYCNEREATVIEELIQAVDPLLIPRVLGCYARGRSTPVERERIRRMLRTITCSRVKSCEALRGKTYILALDLSGTSIESGAIRMLAEKDMGLDELSVLNLAETAVNDPDLHVLTRTGSALNGVIALDLSSCAVSDEGLALLARKPSGVPNLTHLRVSARGVTDNGLRILSDTKKAGPGLRELRLQLGDSRWDLNARGYLSIDAAQSAFSSIDSGRSARELFVHVHEPRLQAPRLHDEALLELMSMSLDAATSPPKVEVEEPKFLRIAAIQPIGVGDSSGFEQLLASPMGIWGDGFSEKAPIASRDYGSLLQPHEYIPDDGGRITDAGFSELVRPGSGAERLAKLNLGRTRITREGVERLRRDRPDICVTLL